MFELGETVIDTKKKQVVVIVRAFDSAVGDLYIVQDENEDFYIAAQDAFIKYDKYYFDEEA